MPNPMYKYPMPTEQLKDQLADMRDHVSELESELDTCHARIAELEQRDAILTALENGGVDNWEGYEAALDEMETTDE
jgi:phage shock protein A